MIPRIALLKKRLNKEGLDALIISKDVNIAYMSSFRGHDATSIITPDKCFLITDSRYIEEAQDATEKCFKVCLAKGSLFEAIAAIVRAEKLKKVGFEARNLPHSVVMRLQDFVTSAKLVPTQDIVEDLRMVKTPDEVNAIRRSLALTRRVLNATMPMIRPGITEEKIARLIETAFIEYGARPSFELIVASGANSSKPHAMPSKKRIPRNSVVMLDVGCLLKGYNSDITRMVLTGNISSKLKEIYCTVKAAQDKAIKAVKPGAKIADVDAAARCYIAEKGFGNFFGHALGHGVGMEVHEKPSISGINPGRLEPGMVFTVEPAIYIPKLGGVRIEDMVLVTDKGCEILSQKN